MIFLHQYSSSACLSPQLSCHLAYASMNIHKKVYVYHLDVLSRVCYMNIHKVYGYQFKFYIFAYALLLQWVAKNCCGHCLIITIGMKAVIVDVFKNSNNNKAVDVMTFFSMYSASQEICTWFALLWLVTDGLNPYYPRLLHCQVAVK